MYNIKELKSMHDLCDTEEELCIMYIIHEELKSLQDLCTTSNTDIDMEYIT